MVFSYNLVFLMAPMNPYLQKLHPYPFEKLRKLYAGIEPPTIRPINLSIGEPKHATPKIITETLCENLAGLATYPSTHGTIQLRQAIADWLARRYRIAAPDAQRAVLPVNGTREALFAFAQAVIPACGDAVVIAPNPFYQIYEGAALLAGASPYYLDTTRDNDYRPDFTSIPDEVLRRAKLIYVCSPGNPTGKVLALDDWKHLFDICDEHDIVIASDECYSELYPDENAPPLGGLESAHRLGRKDNRNLVVFGSLSKRSNAPGLRSGFAAGDAGIIERFLLYRTYHGSAMSPSVQAASAAAWRDEAHVVENRRLYRDKYAAVVPILREVAAVDLPDGGFYLWLPTPMDDAEFSRALYQRYNVMVLPGSFLAREAHGVNPGANFVRIALVAPQSECIEAAERIVQFIKEI